MGLFRNIVDDNKFTPEDVPDFEDKVFFEGAKRRVNQERFAVLLFMISSSTRVIRETNPAGVTLISMI